MFIGPKTTHTDHGASLPFSEKEFENTNPDPCCLADDGLILTAGMGYYLDRLS
jgi:hypothetical protein